MAIEGSKYVFMEDLRLVLQTSDKSLVIYHHMGRQGTAEEQINATTPRRLQQYLEPATICRGHSGTIGERRGPISSLLKNGTSRSSWTGYKSLKGSRAGSSGKLVSNIRTSSW